MANQPTDDKPTVERQFHEDESSTKMICRRCGCFVAWVWTDRHIEVCHD